MTWTDEELVARSIRGDANSFNELILRWERPIYALAYRTIGREEDARDVCQETFLRAFRALPGFRGQAKFSSWLFRIALNLCRDWIRRERRTPVVQPPEDVDLMELAAAELGRPELAAPARRIAALTELANLCAQASLGEVSHVEGILAKAAEFRDQLAIALRAADLTGSSKEIRTRVQALADAGVRHLVLQLSPPFDRTILRRFAKEVMAGFRASR